MMYNDGWNDGYKEGYEAAVKELHERRRRQKDLPDEPHPFLVALIIQIAVIIFTAIALINFEGDLAVSFFTFIIGVGCSMFVWIFYADYMEGVKNDRTALNGSRNPRAKNK